MSFPRGNRGVSHRRPDGLLHLGDYCPNCGEPVTNVIDHFDRGYNCSKNVELRKELARLNSSNYSPSFFEEAIAKLLAKRFEEHPAYCWRKLEEVRDCIE